MDEFIDTRLHSGSELDALLNCCDARAKIEGYTAWNDPKLPSMLKKTIILKCAGASAFPVTLL